MKIAYARLTSVACPVQYEGKLEDGRDFYLRERHNRARLDVPYGSTVASADVEEPPFSLQEFARIFPMLEVPDDLVVDDWSNVVTWNGGDSWCCEL